MIQIIIYVDSGERRQNFVPTFKKESMSTHTTILRKNMRGGDIANLPFPFP